MNMSNKSKNTQLQFFSICLQNPKVLYDTFLKKEYFIKELQLTFQIMKEC